MTTELDIKKLIEDTSVAVEQLRNSQKDALIEVKKLGDTSADTKEKQAKIETDIAGLIQSIAEIKKASTYTDKKSGLSSDELESKNALFKKMRGQQLTDLEQKALNTITNPEGGYLTSSDMSGALITKLRDMSPMRRYANVKTIGKARLEGIINNGRNAATWGYQGQSVSVTATKEFGKYQIDVKDLIAYPSSTTQMIEDADLDIESLIINDTAQAFAEAESSAFLLGDGVLQPRGLMTVATAYTGDNARAWGTVQKFKTGVNGAFAANPAGGDVFIDAAMSLRGIYRAGAVWAMNRFTLAAAMKLKDSTGNYLWQPNWNITDAPFGSICGIPVAPDFDHMADISTGSLSIAIGNINQAYQIVDRRGVVIVRDNITSPTYVKWYVSKRTGGDVINSEAVRFIEFKA